MKKLLRYLFLVLLLFVNVKAKAQQYGNFYWVNKSKGILRIEANPYKRPIIELLSPEDINNISELIICTEIIPGLCKDIPYMNKVTISSSGATSIGDSAFEGCKELDSIFIPETVRITSIGNRAFKDCTLLEGITIPEGVTYIGHDAFKFCNSLANITIPKSVTSIGNGAFLGCGIDTIDIPEGVTCIPPPCICRLCGFEMHYYTQKCINNRCKCVRRV